MDENISKEQFTKQISSLSRDQRVAIAIELYELIKPRLLDQRIPGSMRSHIAQVWSRVYLKQRISSCKLWQLWVMGMKPVGDLKNWRMTDTQCYRLKPRTTQFPYSRPRSNQKKKRRKSIRDINGNAVPWRWIDRFAPHIKTQEDWDRHSIYRGRKPI